MKFLKCEICGNMLGFVEDKGGPVTCCGKNMQALTPGAVDASEEKHVPVAVVNGNSVSVRVGEVDHPMTSEHYIAWVAIETEQGNQRKILHGTPKTEFMICDEDKVVSAYAYCNLHGLWKS